MNRKQKRKLERAVTKAQAGKPKALIEAQASVGVRVQVRHVRAGKTIGVYGADDN